MWFWEDIDEEIHRAGGGAYVRWDCGGTQRILTSDRVFILQLGVESRGIFGAGRARSASYPGPHWRRPHDIGYYIDVVFDVLLNPHAGDVLPRAVLEQPKFAGMRWFPRRLGVTIPGDISARLEVEWERFLAIRTQE